MDEQKLIHCVGCGAPVPDTDGPIHKYIGASPGCWGIYGEILAREYENAAYFSVHQLTVNAYTVQHPGTPSKQSIQSVTVHLIGLYYLIEHGYSQGQLPSILKNATQHRDQFVWLAPPESMGEITVLDLHQTQDVTRYRELARAWAESVWWAWAAHHETIKQWANR